MVPIAIERSLCPPDFSRCSIAATLGGIKVVARGVEQRFGLGRQDSRDEARAHLRPQA